MKLSKFNFTILVPLFFLITAILAVMGANGDGCVNKKQIKKYLQAVTEYAYEYQVEPELVLAVIKAESDFKPDVISKKGAVGLMQLMPSTAGYIAQKVGYTCEIDLKNPDCNIALGCAYLAYLKQKFQTLPEVICAYNAGEGRVIKWLENPKYSTNGKTLNKIEYGETNRYLKRVVKYLKKYKKYLTDTKYYAKQK